MSGGRRSSEGQDAGFRGREKVVEGERAGLYKGTMKRLRGDMERA